MKKFIIFTALLLTVASANPTSALADIGDLPDANALSYGQNPQGCYYTSDSHKTVYSKDFTLEVEDHLNCNRTLVVANTSYYNTVVGRWRASIINYLKSLVK